MSIEEIIEQKASRINSTDKERFRKLSYKCIDLSSDNEFEDIVDMINILEVMFTHGEGDDKKISVKVIDDTPFLIKNEI